MTSKCQPLITSSIWQHRRSALTALLVIIEYTSDLYRPLLSSLLIQLRPLLFDPVRVVRRKAAFFFSEIADYCTSIFLESAPFIVEDIQKVFSSFRFTIRFSNPTMSLISPVRCIFWSAVLRFLKICRLRTCSPLLYLLYSVFIVGPALAASDVRSTAHHTIPCALLPVQYCRLYPWQYYQSRILFLVFLSSEWMH